MVHKADGTTAMQVRYINAPMGYVGKWIDVKTETEHDNNHLPETSSHL